MQADSSSTGGTWLNLGNSSAGGRTWNVIASGSANGEGPGKLLFRDAAAPGVRMTISTNGNVGIGTTSPAATLDVNGTARFGGGTTYTKLQAGTLAVGSSGSGFKVVTQVFAIAFATAPQIVATVRNEPGTDYDASFCATVRKSSITNAVFNIRRVDVVGSWAQNLQLDWEAWE